MLAVSRRRQVAWLAAGWLVVTSLSSISSAASPANSGRPRTGWRHAVSSYLASRAGSAAVAGYDLQGRTWLSYRRDASMVTASIVKLDILETLLHESSHGLSQDQAATARAMIEYSDNDAASELWAQVGRGDGLDRYNQRARLTSTRMDPYGHWGLTRTTPLDETRLMLQLVQPHVLRAGSARYALHLMRHVTPTQRWGVSAGAPAGVSVALKNGWLPVHDDYRNWTVNSVGYVAGAGTRYVIAILSSHDPSESYGIATVQHLSALVASVLQHRRERWVSKSTLPPFDPGDGSPQDGSRG